MESPEGVKIQDFEYSPSSWPEPGTPADMGELVAENIARIESLKVEVMKIASLGQVERDGIFRELDRLRSAFIDLTSSQYRTSSLAAPCVGTAPNMPRPLAERSFSWKNDLIIEGIIGNSAAVSKLLAVIANVAPASLAILLEGETGTGKELFARIIHLNSRRSKFVAVNCGAFPPGVIESELFGHIKGAFTGATSDRKGKFEEANDGTIFLDEISELEPLAQVKLLRVLEVGEIQRVGSDQTHQVNVRVIAATNRNLEEMVRLGKFREDLLYRVNMCPLYLPPLRERRDEIPILLEYFLEEAGAKQNKPVPRVDAELLHFLHHIYDFRGNIRELKNIAQFMACVAGERPVQRGDLPLRVAGETRSEEPPAAAAPPGQAPAPVEGVTSAAKGRTAILRKAEESYWVDLLRKHHGNIRRVCEETRLSPSRVYQILEKCKLRPKAFRT